MHRLRFHHAPLRSRSTAAAPLRSFAVVAATVACFAGAPTAAHAATVSYGPDGTLVLTAAPGEKNSVGVQGSDDDPSIVTLYDGGVGIGTATPAGCTRWQPDDVSSLTCPKPPMVRLELGDGKDWGYVSSRVNVPVTMLGGDGDDQLEGNEFAQILDGGPGQDTVDGNEGDDVVRGGDGADKLDGGSGNDTVEGGAGDDVVSGDGYEGTFKDVIDGGPGFDRIEADWGDRFSPTSAQPPVNITLAGGADDGRPSEGDDLRGVEKVAVNIAGTYVGTDGDDTLEVHQVVDSVKLEGRGGNDTLIGADWHDTLDGGAGNDTLDAGFGDDTINPGAGKDVVYADRRGGDCGPVYCKLPYGNDTVIANDGEVDSIDCGAGTDKVIADAVDIVAANCETIERTGASAGAGGGQGGPGSGVNGGSGTPSGGANSGAALKAAATSPSKAVSRGLTVKLTGGAAGSRVSLTARSGKKLVAKGSAKVSKKGSATVVLKFTKAGKAALRGRSKATLVIDGAGSSLTVTLKK